MRNRLLRRVGLMSMAFCFSLMFVSGVSATEEETDIDDYQWLRTTAEDGKGKTYCYGGAKELFKSICTGEKPDKLTASSSKHIDITMHTKEGEGHFEEGKHNEGDPYARTNTYYYVDNFDDVTKPVSDRSDYVFMGWSTSPDAEYVDVEVDEMTAAMVGTDLYAVWSTKAYVIYHVVGGYGMVQMAMYMQM